VDEGAESGEGGLGQGPGSLGDDAADAGLTVRVEADAGGAGLGGGEHGPHHGLAPIHLGEGAGARGEIVGPAADGGLHAEALLHMEPEPLEQRVLRGEVAMDGAVGDAGFPRDLEEGEVVEAAARAAALDRVEDGRAAGILLAPVAGSGAKRPRGG
jgi:hypothetical protein